MVANNYFYSESEWDRLGCGPLPAERDIRQLELDFEGKNELEDYRQQAMDLWFFGGSCTGGKSEQVS